MVYVGNVLYKYKGVMPSNTIIDVREGIKSISSWAFNNCSGLVAVNLPNSISKIGTGAFRHTSLSKVFIPNNVESIGEDAFYGCGLLDSVIIGDGVKSIGGYAFYNCSLRSVSFGKNVSWIAEYAFAHNTSLVSIVLGDNVGSIGNYAFYNCSSLESITIPQAMKNIHYKAFYECSSLANIFYRGTEGQWENIQISDYNNVLYEATKHFCVDISEEVSVIGLSESYVYTGSEIKPDVKVLYDEEELVLGVDYEIAYVDNVQVGTATLIVKMCGKYVGEVTLKFDIIEETATLMDYIDSNESGILYNIQGHRVLNHERGLLITNGRKILIK